jgi:integrase
MATRKRRENFGAIRKLPSGRIQASYVGPDGRRHTAPKTYDNVTDARAWLATQQAAIYKGTWDGSVINRDETVKKSRSVLFGDYADKWITTRKSAKGKNLSVKTQEDYRKLLARPLEPFLEMPISAITPEIVRSWHTETEASGKITQTSHAYSLLKTILQTAIDDRIISFNPCIVRGAQNARTGIKPIIAKDAELKIMVDTIRPRFRAMVLLAAWGQFRYSELVALTRSDLSFTYDDEGNVDVISVDISKSVKWPTGAKPYLDDPKTDAGIRVIYMPPFITSDILKHLDEFVEPGDDALLFPAASGGYLRESTFTKSWYPARAAAGQPKLRFHDLRHYGATRYAQIPTVTRKELQDRLGHASDRAAMRYQHSTGRDAELVKLMREK